MLRTIGALGSDEHDAMALVKARKALHKQFDKYNIIRQHLIEYTASSAATGESGISTITLTVLVDVSEVLAARMDADLEAVSVEPVASLEGTVQA